MKLVTSPPQLWREIAREISAAIHQVFTAERLESMGGGCINATFRLSGGGRRFFVKLNAPDKAAMFEAEAEGLLELGASESIRLPEPICRGMAGNASFLVLEYIEMASCGAACCERLGQRLARLHRHTGNSHGWWRDNTIGSTPQINAWNTDWAAFWSEQRLGFQLALAGRNGLSGRLLDKGEQLLDALPLFFSAYAPRASLLHGDLWGGNIGATPEGEPVIFDPAVYYGDRETDLAMTELFGGFSPRFHAAYREDFPPDPGYATRKTLYNLYHILNHANLFGGGYAIQAEGMIDRLLSEIK